MNLVVVLSLQPRADGISFDAGRRLSQLWRAREIVAFLQARVAQA